MRLHEIAQKVIVELTPNGVEVVVSFIQGIQAGKVGLLSLGLDRIAALLPETASPNDRDHLVLVYLATIESHLYRQATALPVK